MHTIIVNRGQNTLPFLDRFLEKSKNTLFTNEDKNEKWIKRVYYYQCCWYNSQKEHFYFETQTHTLSTVNLLLFVGHWHYMYYTCYAIRILSHREILYSTAIRLYSGKYYLGRKLVNLTWINEYTLACLELHAHKAITSSECMISRSVGVYKRLLSLGVTYTERLLIIPSVQIVTTFLIVIPLCN